MKLNYSSKLSGLKDLRVILLATAFFLLFGLTASAQLTGTKNIPGDYATLDLAITDLNTQGVGAGGVILNVLAGNPETAPVGGYAITTLTGTAANPITIVGNSNVITANGGLTAGALNDAIFKIIGGDYITITGFSMMENPANTTTAAGTNNMTEFGVALFYANTADGAQNNSIVGNTITLNKTYLNTWGVYSNVRHDALLMTTTADIVAASGSNSNNKIYGNIISNVNMGIAFIGSNNAAYMDSGNDIGGNSVVTGNTISNWGGAAASSAYVSNSGTSYCIFMNHQTGDNIQYNTITSSAVSGTAVTFRGIVKDYTATAPTGTFTSVISNNTITMSSGFTSGTFNGIASAGLTTLATATINIENNLILDCALTSVTTSGGFVGVLNSSAPGVLSISNNVIRGFTSSATNGTITGISNTGAVVNTTNLNNNQLGNSTSGFITFSVANSGTLSGILCTGAAATCALSISGNNFQGINYTAGGTATTTFINCTAVPSSFLVNNNTFNNLSIASTGTTTFILMTYSTTTGTGTKTVTNNSIVTGFAKTGASGNTLLLSDNGSSSTGTLTTVQNNNFSNINITGSGTFTGINLTDGGTAPTKNITNNTISNVTGASGNVTCFNITYWNGVSTMSNNTISNITSQSIIIGMSLGSTVNTATSITVATNTITALSSTGTGANVTGIATTNTSPIINITGNIINTLSSTAASAIVQGISVAGATNTSVYGNVISGLTTSGGTSPQSRGIAVNAGNLVNVYKNKIYNLTTTAAVSTTNPAVSGILIGGSTTTNVYNNLIGDLTAPSANLADAIRGINITSTTASASYNIYYNTININASSIGANFGTTGIYHTTSATATTANLTLRNNIVINNSTAAGTGLTVAYRRSSTTLTNFNNASNNNNYYAGTPGASNLIYNDGTNSAQTLAAYTTLVGAPYDNVSVTENTTFLSTTGSASNFLHVDPAIANLVESAASNISGYTDDYDADIRSGNGGYTGTGSAPDIGADEFEGTSSATCAGTPTAGTVTGSAAICENTGTTLSLSGTSTGVGYTYQWQSATTPGGPYTNMGTTLSQATGNLSATMYYILTVTCTGSGMSATTPEYTLTVNPNPTINVSPTTGTICLPGGASIPLTASGTSTSYTWTPSAGLSATTGANVTANPTSTTIYTVTGTDGNGCSSSTSATITVSNNPTITSVTATPSTICLGGTSQLNVATSASVVNYVFTGSTGTYTPITGTTLPGAIGDDNGTGNLPIGFNFGYNGNTYTVFGVWSNGNVQLGNTTVNLTGNFTNNLATSTNMLAALWDDNNTTGGTVSYTTTGTTPNRVLTIQWTGMHVGGGGSSTNPTIDVQMMLFETTGEIRIVYGSTSAAFTGTTASIGISATAGQYISVTPLSPASSSTTSTSTANNGISSAANFPSGTIYSFVPPANTYAWTPSLTLNDTTLANPIGTNITVSTQYTVAVTNSFGCTSTGTVDVTVSPLTSAGIAANPATPICVGASVILSSTPVGGGPFTYTWTPGGATTSSNTVTPTSTTVYTLTVSNSCGETVTDNITVSVNSLPNVSATAATTLYCTPGSPAIALNANGASTYTWLPAAGLDMTNVSNPNASPVNSTTYTVTGTDGNGCQDTATVSITAAPAITGITASASQAVICAGDTIDLSSGAVVNATLFSEDFNAATNAWTTINNSVNGTPAAAAWTLKASGTTSFGNAITSNDNSQMYVSDSDAQGSGSTTNTSLTSPRIDASNYATLNLSFFHFFRFNAVPDAGNVEVSTDGTNYSVVQSYTATTGAAAAFNNANINLDAYAGNDSLYVRFSFKSSWGWGWAVDNVSITGTLTSLNYAWTSTPGGFTSTVQNPTGVIPSGTTTYDVVISNVMGCSDTASTTVTVNALPIVMLGNDSSICSANAPLTLDAGNTGATFSWNTAETSQTIAIDSSYSYSVEVTDGNGCVGRDTINVTVNAQPVVNLGTDSTQCGGTVTLDAGNAGATYMWSDATTAQTLIVTNSGTYGVSVTSPQGCESSDTIVVTINSMPIDNLGNDTLYCGSNFTLDAGNSGSTYSWNTTETTQTINVTSTGQYFVSITTAQNCSDVDTINVTISPAISVSLGNDSAVCQSTGIILDAQNPGATYLWNDNSNSSTLIVTTPGTYYVLVTSVDGCTASDTVVYSDNSPAVTLSLPFTTTCVNTSVNTLSGGSPSGGFYSGPGVTGTNFNATTVGSFVISYTYTDGTTGCAATDTQTVVVDPCIGLVKTNNAANISIAPNPNNGIFTIVVPSKEGVYSSEIYSLDGKLVSKATLSGRENYEVNLSNLANAIYYLRITIDGETNIFKVVKQD